MYSQCPECQTRFRVTAEVLRVAQGTVRCGRCGSAFNALSSLTDNLTEPASAATLVPPQTILPSDLIKDAGNGNGHHRPADSNGHRVGHSAGPGPDPQGSDFHFSADDIERVFVDSRDWQRQFGGERRAGSEDGPVVEVDETGTFDDFEDITLEGERIHIEGVPDFLHDAEDKPESDADNRDGVSGAETNLAIDEELLEKQAEAPGLDRQGKLDAELLEAELQEALNALGPTPDFDLEPTGRFATLKHVPDSSSAEDARTRHVPLQDPDLPEIVPVAAVGNAMSARVPPSAATSPMPAVVAASAAQRPRTSIGDPRRPGARRGARAGARAVAIDDRDAVRSNAGLWGLGALLLAIVLGGQLAHYFRQDLLRDPNLGPALRRIYERLDVRLEPNWDLRAYELRQWGASDTVPVDGAMTVRASIKNRASYAQPLPLLRVDLEDRFGGRVASRDFEAKQYLKDAGRAARMLGANDVAEAELALADIAPDAVGYRLDVCVREGKRGVVCAQPSRQ